MKNEVEFNHNSIVKIDYKDIEEMKRNAKRNGSGKFRLCLQHSAQDMLHEMFIVRTKGDYFQPDKHLYTTESHTIVDGAMLIILFEENGSIREVFELSEKCYRTYRIDTNIYHMQIPITDQVVYYEVKSGPFDSKSNIYPDWAPNSDDQDGICKFKEKIERDIKEYFCKNDPGK